MKSSIFYALNIILILFCTNACSNEQIDIQEVLKTSSSRVHIPNKADQITAERTIIIYDGTEGTGLNLIPIKLNKLSGNIKKDIITAFLEHNHFLENKNQITLSRIEEFDHSTTFYLTSVQQLNDPANLPLFKRALELTIMRNLKDNDFNIIYGQTAQL